MFVTLIRLLKDKQLMGGEWVERPYLFLILNERCFSSQLFPVVFLLQLPRFWRRNTLFLRIPSTVPMTGYESTRRRRSEILIHHPSDCICSTYRVVTPVTRPGPWSSTSMGSRWRRRSRGSTPGGTSSPRRRTSSPCSRRGSRTRPRSSGIQTYLMFDFSAPLTPQVLEHQWRLRYLWRCLWQRQVTGRRRWG